MDNRFSGLLTAGAYFKTVLDGGAFLPVGGPVMPETNATAPATLSGKPLPLPLYNEPEDYAGDASTTARLTLGGSIMGSLSSDTDVDWIGIEVELGQLISFTSDLTEIDSRLSLVDREGNSISAVYLSGDDDDFTQRIDWLSNRDGLVYLSVEAFVAVDSYTITAEAFEDDHGNERDDGTVFDGVGASVDGRLDNQADRDWFQLDLSAGENVFVSTGYDSGLEISIHSFSGALLERANGEPFAFRAREDGTYYIRVQSGNRNPGDATTDYTLSVAGFPDDYAGDATTTGSLGFDTPLSGAFQTHFDSDWFAIDIPAVDTNQRVVLTATFGDRARDINLVDADGNRLLGDTFSDFYSGVSRITINPSLVGTFFIELDIGFLDLSTETSNTYTLSAEVVEDDYSADISTTGSVDIGTIVTGAIDFDDDVDWIAINMVAGERISLVSTDNSLLLQLVDAEGTALDPTRFLFGFDIAEQVYTTETGGQFYLRLSTDADIGDYAISVANLDSADDYADTRDEAERVAIGEMVAGVISGSEDEDLLRIEITQDGAYLLDGRVLNGLFELLDSDGNHVTSGTGFSSYTDYAPGFFSDPAPVDLDAGTYYIRFGQVEETNDRDPGRFSFSYEALADDYRANGSTTGTIALGSSAIGRIDFEYDSDWFAIEVEAGVAYRVDADDFYELRILDVQSDGISALAAGYEDVLFRAERDGVVFVSISDTTVRDYTLSFSILEDDFGNTADTAGLLEVDGADVRGTFEIGDDRDWFALDLTEGQMIGFNQNYNADYRLVAADGTVIATNLHESQTFRALETTTYYLEVFDENAFGTGRGYTVSAFASDDDYVASTNTRGIFDLSEGTASGRIDFDRDEDWFRIEAEDGGIFTFNHSEGENAYFFIVDTQGNILGGLGSDNTLELDGSQTYYIATGTYGGTADYTLSVTQTEDDYGSGPVGAGSLTTGAETAARFTADIDVDAFEVTLDGATNYTFTSAYTSDEASPSGFVMALQDADGQVVAQNYRSYTDQLQLNFAAEDGGTYYLVVTRRNPDGEADYAVSMQDLGGSNGDDILFGTNTDDSLSGFGGDDIIAGSNGADYLFGGDGNDRLEGDVPVYMTADSAESVVFRAYQAVFDRAPDAAGYQAVLNEYVIGNLSQREILEAFIASDEFQNTYGDLSNADFVAQLYRNTLDREGDAQGLANFTNALNDVDLSRTDVVEFFANSPEFIRLSEMPSALFSSAVIGAGEIEMAVFRSYQAVFDRAPDFDGFQLIVAEVLAGRLNLSETLVSFTFSVEFKTAYADFDDRAFVEQLYRNVFDREGDAAGVDVFTTALEAGDLTRAQVVESFVQSFEFRQATDGAAIRYVAQINALSSLDVLEGGAGDDILFGGHGRDVFLVGEGRDTVLDFNVSKDSVDFGRLGEDFDTEAEMRSVLSQVGDDAVFDFGGGNLMILQNVDVSQLSADNFRFSYFYAEAVDDPALI